MTGSRRAWVGVVAAAIAGALALEFARGQFVEARLTAAILHLVTGWHLVTVAHRPVFYFPRSSGPAATLVGLKLTGECSGLLMVIPVIVAGGIIGSVRRFPLSRVVAGVGVGVATMVMTNQVRLDCIVLFIRWLGLQQGYPISHVYVGSLLAIVGFVIGTVLFIKVITGGRRPEAIAP